MANIFDQLNVPAKPQASASEAPDAVQTEQPSTQGNSSNIFDRIKAPAAEAKPIVNPNDPHILKAQELEQQSKDYKKNSSTKTEAFGGGAGKGMLDIYDGIATRLQQGLAKVGVDTTGTRFDNYLKQEAQDRQTWDKGVGAQHPIVAGVGEALGQAAALPVPPVMGAGATIAGTAAKTAANFGAAGAVYNSLDVNNSDKSMLESGAHGAVAGALTGLAAGAAGGVLKNGVQSLLRPGVSGAEQQAFQDVASQTGLKPTYGQLAQSPAGKSMENLMGDMPFNNMNAYKAEGQHSIEPAINTFTNQMAGKWADVPESNMVSHLNAMKATTKAQTDALYTNAANLAKQSGIKPDPTPIKNFLEDQIDNYTNLPGKDAKRLVGELKDQMGHSNNLTYDNINNNINYLSKLAFKKYNQAQNGTALPDEYKVLYSLRDKYLDSLDVPNAPSEVKGALTTAREFYQKNMTPFNDPKLQQYMGQEIAIDKFLKSMTGEARAGATPSFFNSLQDSDKQLLRKDLLNFVKTDATAADGTLDTQKFLGKLNQYSSLKPHLFGDEIPKFEAFTGLLKNMSQDGGGHGSSASALTGLGTVAVGLAHPASLVATLPAAASLWAYSRMSSSEAGRQILINMSKLGEKTDPYLAKKITQQGQSTLSNLIRQIPSIYMKGASVNTERQDKPFQDKISSVQKTGLKTFSPKAKTAVPELDDYETTGDN